MGKRGRDGRGLLLLIGALVLATTALVPDADAATPYAHLGSFGGSGSGPGQFSNPNRIAVDSTTGYVFVADTGNNRVQVFDGTCLPACGSTPLLTFADTAPLGIAVDSSSGVAFTTHAGANEMQSYPNNPFGSGAANAYRLIFAGEPTVTLSANQTVTPIQEALEALPAIGPGNVTVQGNPRVITFVNVLGSTDVPPVELEKVSDGTKMGANLTANGAPGAVSRFLPDDHLTPTSYVADGTFASPAVTGIAPGGTGGSTSPAFGGIAVDPVSHDLYLTLGKSVGRFAGATGAPIGLPFNGTPGTTAFSATADLAIDGSGHPIVADIATPASTRVLRFDSSGGLQAALTPPPANPSALGRRIALAADIATGEVFASASPSSVSAGVKICQYEADALFSNPCIIAPPTATALAFLRGLAASGTSPGRLYAVAFDNSGAAGSSGPPTIQVFEAKEPPAVTIEAVGDEDVSATEATFHGTVNPRGVAIATCRFEVVRADDGAGFGSAAAKSLPCKNPDGTDAGTIEADLVVDHPLKATATGLEPNTAYRVRLRAVRVDGLSGTAETPDPFETDAVPPVAITGGAWSVSDVSATLAGTVDPRNSMVAECRFEYVTVAAFSLTEFDDLGSGGSAECAPGPGAGLGPVEVTAEVDDLAPSTDYRFRLVADNGVGGLQAGGASAFATRAPVVFPQRGFELVSAFLTNGNPSFPVRAAADGNHYAYGSFVIPLPGAETGAIGQNFRASRHPDGSWTQAYAGTPPPDPGQSGSPLPAPVYSADLSRAAFGSGSKIDPEDVNGAPDAYLRDMGSGGALTWLSRGQAEPNSAPAGGGVALNLGPKQVSPDGRRVYLHSARRLRGEDTATGSSPSLYVWEGGALSLVGVRPGFSTGFANGSALGSSGSTIRAGGGGGLLPVGQVSRNAASPDGRRVAFQSGPTNTTQRLYVRIDGELTVEASASALDPTPLNVNYWGADAQTTQVFFTSSSALTADSGAPDAEGPTDTFGIADLYRYTVPLDGDPASGELVDLTPHPGGAGVTHVLRVSDDGRRVYFLAKGALAPGAAPAPQCNSHGGGGGGLGGACNLYLAEFDDPADSEAALTLIARGEFPVPYGYPAIGGEQPSELNRQVDAAPDGSVFAFRSLDDLVPGRRGGENAQVYVYEAGRDELHCASCPPDGSVPDPVADPRQHNSAGLTPGRSGGGNPLDAANPNVTHVRNVSADGAVFFQTATPLLPVDANGRRSVYEWRGGRLGLITAGDDPSGARFGDATPGDSRAAGATVFFQSSGAYVPGVPGGTERIYAARVGGGFVAPPPDPPCTGEDCKPVATPQPNYAAPSTSTVGGRGNVDEKQPPRKCRRGKIRRKGRCVTRKAAKKKAKRAQRRANRARRAAR